MSVDTSRVEELFHAAQQIENPHERQVWLETACADEPALRGRVESLLSAAAEASQFLNRPAVELANAAAALTQGFAGSSVNSGSGFGRRGTEKGEELSFLQPTSRSDSLGRLGHYEVLEVIGQGGFGIVLRAFDEKLHRVVALKVLAPELAANGSARKRFVREARTAAAVKNEHVVGIYGVEENAQPPYLAMEMIDGKSLQEKIDQQGPLSLAEILRIGLQMAEGLAAAHKQGLVHRDIKPANILLENGVERVKITDFGLARAVDDASVTQSGTVAGTPMYMSPEQAEGLAIDHRSDLFSLGTVLYAMCTGHSAFRASGTHAVLKRVIEAAPRPIREVNPEIPEWLTAIIGKLHAKNPDERFQTAKEVAELLGQHLAHLQQPNQTPRPAQVWVPARKDDPQPDKILSGSVALLSTIRAIVVYSVVISCVIFLGTWYLGWHIRTVVRVGSVLFSLLVLASVGLAVFAMKKRRVQWARALEESAIAFGILTFAFSMVTFCEWLSPIPDLIEVPRDHSETIVDAGFVPLFNGADLAGWKTHPDEPGDWKVEEGALVGANKPSYLFSERDDYTDFHLRCEVQINKGGDAGIFGRTPFVLAGSIGMPAYEAQISPGKPTNFGWGTGAIGTTTVPQGWYPMKEAWTDFPADTWVPMEVIVRGNTIETRVSGKTVAEFTDPDRLYTKGHIALQQSGEKTRVQFRKLEIKELAPVVAESAEVQALREAVAALEKSRDIVRRQFDAGQVTKQAVVAADGDWIEARIRLAEAKASHAEVIWLFTEELIPKLTEEQRLASERVKAGLEPVSMLNAVDVRLADAKIRLVRATGAMQKATSSQSQRR